MTQDISVLKTDESHERLAQSEVNFAEIQKEMVKISDYINLFPWLSTINPYSNTYFNSLQIPHLVSELENLSKQNQLTDYKDKIDILISFIKDLQTHDIIRFVGD